MPLIYLLHRSLNLLFRQHKLHNIYFRNGVLGNVFANLPELSYFTVRVWIALFSKFVLYLLFSVLWVLENITALVLRGDTLR